MYNYLNIGFLECLQNLLFWLFTKRQTIGLHLRRYFNVLNISFLNQFNQGDKNFSSSMFQYLLFLMRNLRFPLQYQRYPHKIHYATKEVNEFDPAIYLLNQ